MKKILIIGAHPDDVEIGCLGYMIKNAKRVNYDILVASGNDKRIQEMDESIDALSKVNIKVNSSKCLRLGDGFLYEDRKLVKEQLNELRLRTDYDSIFTHYREDMHQDHRLIAEVTLEVFRTEQIISYEIPKYDGCTFRPSLYIKLDKEMIDFKVNHLITNYRSQQQKKWYRKEVFYGQAAIRGVECNHEWAEAYFPVKIYI